MTVILEHLAIYSNVVTLNADSCLGSFGIDDEMVIAVRAVFVALIELLGVLSEALLALLASKNHLQRLQKGMAFLLLMAVCTVKPLPAYGKLALCCNIGSKARGVQHGERMATCAFRTCLLSKVSCGSKYQDGVNFVTVSYHMVFF